MLLDLVDNAVDAAMPPKGDDDFTGRVHIYRDLYEVMPGQVYTTGLCLRNNSHQKIAPMKEVLQLFISAKANSGSESIGENGVGLKQSCAACAYLVVYAFDVLCSCYAQLTRFASLPQWGITASCWLRMGPISLSLESLQSHCNRRTR